MLSPFLQHEKMEARAAGDSGQPPLRTPVQGIMHSDPEILRLGNRINFKRKMLDLN